MRHLPKPAGESASRRGSITPRRLADSPVGFNTSIQVQCTTSEAAESVVALTESSAAKVAHSLRECGQLAERVAYRVALAALDSINPRRRRSMKSVLGALM